MKNKLFNSLLPIESERLFIKKTTNDDINLILKMDKQNETQKYLGGIKNKTYEERINFLNKKINSLTIYLKDKNIPIGFIDFNINEINNSVELSYIFDYDYTRNGYCFESCSSLIKVAFNDLNVNKIIADTICDNISSIKVLEKLGFKYINENIKNNNKFLNYELNKK